MAIETAATSGLQPIPAGRVSYEQFLSGYDDEHHYEWVDGEVEIVSPGATSHQALILWLASILQIVAEADDLGRVFVDGFQMRLADPPRGREPDVMFVAAANLGRIRRTYLDGPADLAVEIVSEDSFARDRGDKFREYEQSGVPEYWLIDPERRQAEFYVRGADGRYRLVLGGAEGTYASSALPRLRLDVDALWREPLPKVAATLRAMGVLEG